MIKFIHIINSKENIQYKIKYLACSQANTSARFFIDDRCNVLSIYDDHKVHEIPFRNTWKAVDGNISTCWQTNRTIYSGDFLYAQTNITFVLIVSHNRIMQANLEMSISFNGI
ncbi:unnamed protein product [Adineta steineri]|uniref:Uncharacterized protein n=1 Tax=Adineta steineri TaxID=433720 RepID=A0A814BYT3_9BILA|nr:unnamed protein product [Adineta steineri]CAF4125894.1 unnamed protein product [Adineta steineri]